MFIMKANRHFYESLQNHSTNSFVEFLKLLKIIDMFFFGYEIYNNSLVLQLQEI
jgi:hypothetical protein